MNRFDLFKKMPNLCQWAICSVLLWSTLSHASQRPTFEWRDPHTHKKLLCEKCPAGMKVAKPCTQDTQTECKPCGNQQYMQEWNYLNKCFACRFPCSNQEVEVTPCNKTHNRVCECKPGYHAESLFCIKHFPCPPGSGVVEPGNKRKDTQCRACPQGTFSGSHSAQEPCQPHQTCSGEGLRVNVPGSRYHNAYCTACRADRCSNGSSGSGECYEAALDFVAFQVKSPKRLRRLYRKLTQTPPGTEKKPIEELQLDFHSYLLQLKNLHGKEKAWNMVQGALAEMKLERILQNIHMRFSVGL